MPPEQIAAEVQPRFAELAAEHGTHVYREVAPELDVLAVGYVVRPGGIAVTIDLNAGAIMLSILGKLEGNISMRLGRKLSWDTVREEFKDDEEASAFLSCPMRAPWTL